MTNRETSIFLLATLMLAGVFLNATSKAAIFTVDLGGEVLETGGINDASELIDLGGTLGVPMFLNYQNSPSLIIRAMSGNTGYYTGNTAVDTGGVEVFFQTADGTVSYPTTPITFTRPTWHNGHWDDTQAGENFFAVRSVDGEYGWLNYSMGDGTSTAITLNYYAYDDQVTDIADAPTLVNGVVTSSGAETEPIPEPSTFIIWSLLGALGITYGWWRRRTR